MSGGDLDRARIGARICGWSERLGEGQLFELQRPGENFGFSSKSGREPRKVSSKVTVHSGCCFREGSFF